MSRKVRITLSDELGARLDDHASATLRAKDAIIEAAIAEYLAAHLGLVPNGPPAGPEWTTTPQVVEPPPVKDPLKGAKPGDTDEILALIRSVNELPASTELSGDMVFVNAERRATIHRQIAVLRRAVEESRLQVAQNQ